MVKPYPEPMDNAARHEGGKGMPELVHERDVQAKPTPRGSRDAEQDGGPQDAEHHWERDIRYVFRSESPQYCLPPVAGQICGAKFKVPHPRILGKTAVN